jgi:hypothetical protein
MRPPLASTATLAALLAFTGCGGSTASTPGVAAFQGRAARTHRAPVLDDTIDRAYVRSEAARQSGMRHRPLLASWLPRDDLVETVLRPIPGALPATLADQESAIYTAIYAPPGFDLRRNSQAELFASGGLWIRGIKRVDAAQPASNGQGEPVSDPEDVGNVHGQKAQAVVYKEGFALVPGQAVVVWDEPIEGELMLFSVMGAYDVATLVKVAEATGSA